MAVVARLLERVARRTYGGNVRFGDGNANGSHWWAVRPLVAGKISTRPVTPFGIRRGSISGRPPGLLQSCAVSAYSSTRPRPVLILPRRTLLSTRRRWELLVGLVRLRVRGTTAASSMSSCRRTMASSRFRS